MNTTDLIIDSSMIYCLATGKPIAQVTDDEFGCIIDSLSHMPMAARFPHLEKLTLCSMRPSLLWMNLTPDSIEAIRQSTPRQLLAYLLNRLYAPIDVDKYGKPMAMESWLQARRTRIGIWQIIESAHFTDENLDRLLLVLLELDSKFNLAKLQKPQSVTSLWTAWHNEYVDTLVKQLESWRKELTIQREKLDARTKFATEFWSQGNRLTRKSYIGQFAKVDPKPDVATHERHSTKLIRAAKIAKLKDSLDFLDELEKNFKASEAVRPVAPKSVTPGRVTKLVFARKVES